MIENKHIRSFLQVLDLGSFSKAARSLNIAQPALSQHVRKLEHSLGVRLLDRNSHGVTATASGRKFSARAREILSLVDTTERLFKADQKQLIGEVRFGLPGSVCPVLAPQLMLKAAKEYPQVSFKVTELMSGDLAEMLRSGRLDAAILFNTQESEDFTSRHIVTERLNLIGHPEARFVAEATVSARYLRGLPLVGTHPPHGLRLLLERWSSETDIPLNFEFEADSPSILTRLAASGACYSIVAKAAIEHEIRANTLGAAEITDPALERRVSICVSKRVPPDAAREALVNLIERVSLDMAAKDQWPGATALP